MTYSPPVIENLSPGLYIVATPIGNLEDITLRGLRTLKSVDSIGCEDTRTSGILLKAYGIDVKTFPYHDHNAENMRSKVISRLLQGEAIALISDAGTPLISDPGYKLVQECYKNGIHVHSIPGPCGLITSLTLGGLPTDRFYFGGFLNSKATQRQKQLQALRTIEGTLVFYEAPHRTIEFLEDAFKILGNRTASVTRELTKKFEEVRTAPLEELLIHYHKDGPPRGEVIVLVDGNQNEETSGEELESLILKTLESHSVKDTVALVASLTGVPKKEVYALALRLTNSV